MTGDEVLRILAGLGSLNVWIGGGWGIDALIGRATRPHRDLDLMHRQDQEPAVLAALTELGFTESLDWRPVRFVVTDADRREIDLHPLIFQDDGSLTQASPDPEQPFLYPAQCFVTGSIQGRSVPCLSAEQQAYFHQGYQPTDRDIHDMTLLRETFGVHTHF